MFIPENSKYIHLIWVGPKPMLKDYYSSVEKYCPKGFKIHIWTDEDIIPLCEDCEYFRMNYNLHRYAFASDYARFKILSEYGGIYIDTDVEFINPIDDYVEKGSFMAVELIRDRISSGLITYMKTPHDPIVDGVVQTYENHDHSYITEGELVLKYMEPYGYKRGNFYQELSNGMTIYKGGTFDWNLNCGIPREHAKAIHHYTHLW